MITRYERYPGLTADEIEDIRFALARCAVLNREMAEKYTRDKRVTLAQPLIEQADRFEALARKVSS